MENEEIRDQEVNDQLPAEEPGAEPVGETMPPPDKEHFPEDPEGPVNGNSDLAAQLAEEKDRYLRLYSEFDNFRRRTSREKMEMMQTAGKDIILSMISVMDDFERALSLSAGLDPTLKANLDGFELIYKKMHQSLESRGLKAMDSKGQPFDVEFHEAVTRFPAPSEDMKGKVIDEVEKGYTLNGHVIRFAKVVVGE